MSHAAKHSENESHLKESAAAVSDAVADLAGEAARVARNRVASARDSAAAAVDTVKSKAADCNDQVVDFIRENPFKSLALAAGIGVAAGWLLRRR